MKSLICEAIKNNKNNWEGWFSENYPNIIIKKDENLKYAIFRYTHLCNYKDPLVREARGIIIDYEYCKPVCWAFNKFGRYDENYVDNIYWESAELQEKIDGSIIKLWYSEKLDRWIYSSNYSIYASDAYINDSLTIMDAINDTEEVNNINYDKLDRNTTYIFELVVDASNEKYNKLVHIVHYSKTKLYFIGSRNNITGEEMGTMSYIGVETPTKYGGIYSLEEAIYTANIINQNSNHKYDNCILEGFVAVDINGNRIKIKSEIYSMLHHLTDFTEKSRNKILDLLIKNKLNIDCLISNYPELTDIILYYAYQYNRYIKEANNIIDIIRQGYELCDRDKSKLYSNPLLKDKKYIKYKYYIYECINNKGDVFDLLKSNKKYKGNRYYSLFSAIPVYSPMNNKDLLSSFYLNKKGK